MLDPRIIANTFLAIAQQKECTIDPMKLQKLIYIAHGMYLAKTGRSLSTERPQAWRYGPVFPSVYQQFKRFGASAISDWYGEYDFERRNIVIPVANNDIVLSVIYDVWNRSINKDAVTMSAITHEKGSPWEETYGDGHDREKEIPDDLLKAFYTKNPYRG